LEPLWCGDAARVRAAFESTDAELQELSSQTPL
jgi:hypothetical protein